MKIDNAGLVDGTVQLGKVVGKHDAVIADDIAGPTDARGGIVSMLGHLVAGPGDDKAGCRRNVERVLPVATRPHDVDVAVAIQGDRNAGGQDSVTKTKKFVDRNATHLDGGEQRRDFRIGELLLRDTDQDGLRFFTGEHLVVHDS